MLNLFLSVIILQTIPTSYTLHLTVGSDRMWKCYSTSKADALRLSHNPQLYTFGFGAISQDAASESAEKQL